ncbi:MAG: AAA family ATPase [Clostridia bacterium]|nr:AAA family ATPase [Clostridia bacterium]
MKILLFGISNVGKSTIGKQLSRKLEYDFDDLDEEIKRQYGKIDNFQLEYPFDYERHRKRGEILKEIIDKYDDNVVIAVSVINYSRIINDIIKNKEILAIEIQDKPENILKRLVYADEEDKIFQINISNIEQQKYYLKDIKKDITYYKKIYSKIENKFYIDGKLPEEATEDLVKFIEKLK